MLAISLGALGSTAGAGEYLLGPQDKIRLKIYEWRASRDVIFEWTALNDQFTVGQAGSLSLPFVGDIEAQGVTPSALGVSIGERLMRNMGLGRQPDVSVEIVQFRPFYIVGHVMEPGEFPYRPGLTVLQALSIAGGARTREDGTGRFERELIAGRGDVDLIRLDTIGLMARKARLLAELADAEAIEFPEQLTSREKEESVALAMEQERRILMTRRQALITQIRTLEELRAFLGDEFLALQSHLAFQDKQVELVQKELTGISSLVKQGLAVAAREIALERALMQSQSDRLSAQTSLLRARQEISRTDLAILELRNRAAYDATVALRETQAQLDKIARQAETAVQLLYESEMSAPGLVSVRTRTARREPTYTIVRPSDGGTIEIPAIESDAVEPGDTIKVQIPFPDELDGLISQPATVEAPNAGIATVKLGQLED
ncbi:polysaccharide biosynthesis/export family protein [Aurantimonas sp. A2-1-M11]